MPKRIDDSAIYEQQRAVWTDKTQSAAQQNRFHPLSTKLNHFLETETELDVIISSSISLVTLGTFCQRKSDVPMQNWQNFDILNGITCPMTWHCPFNSVNFNMTLPSVIFNVFPSKARNYGRSRRRVWRTVFVAHNTISDCLQLGTP